MVLVSHRKAFVFLKTRKTAGTSVEMLLEPFCTPRGHVVSEVTPTLRSRAGVVGRRLVDAPPRGSRQTLRHFPDWYNHMPAQDVARRLGPRWSRYLKIACVRNPFDRTLSMFRWRLQLGQVEAAPDQLPGMFRKFIATNWPDDREVVTIDDRIVVDHFVRYETLRQDLAALADRLEMDIDLSSMPHTKNLKNKEGYDSPDEMCDEKSIDTVRRRLRWVFETFDYPDRPTWGLGAQHGAGNPRTTAPARRPGADAARIPADDLARPGEAVSNVPGR